MCNHENLYVLQVEWHPHYHQDDVLDLCRREGILLQAYSSLGGSNDKTLINDNTVKAIAAKNHISPAQVSDLHLFTF